MLPQLLSCPDSPLDAALACHRLWRDRGNDLLIVFLIVELLLEAWREPPKSWSPWPSVKFRVWLSDRLPSKEKLMLLAAFMVAISVGIERWQGNKADDVVDQWRIQLLTAIAPIHLSEPERRELRDACRQFAGKVSIRVTMTTGLQGAQLGVQIWSAFKEAGFDVGDPEWTFASVYGVSLASPVEPNAIDASNCIGKALLKMKKFPLTDGVVTDGTSIRITVGEKEIGRLPE